MKQLANILGMAGIGLATAVAGHSLRASDASTTAPGPSGETHVPGAGTAVDVEQWAGALRRAGAQGRGALEREARTVDPTFGRGPARAHAPCDDATNFVGVEVAWGQLDGDAAREATVHVVYASPAFEGERCEEHWVGFFDADGSAMRLRGSVESLLSHCEVEGPEGIRTGFLQDNSHHGGVVLISERAQSCNDRASVRFERQTYRLERGALVTL